MIYYLALISTIILTSISQILLKKSTLMEKGRIKIFIHHYNLAGYTFFLFATISSVFALQQIDLKTLIASRSLTFIFVAFLARIFLKEYITRKNYIGLSFIAVGIIIYSL